MHLFSFPNPDLHHGLLSWPEQSELATIVVGRYNVFLLRYAAKVHELAPDVRAEWIKKLSAAAINSSQK
jgi:hypothetical protein